MGNDIELCAEVLKDEKDFLKDPYAAIQRIVKTRVRSDGSAFFFDDTKAQVRHLEWLAQIRTIYPETYREKFIRKYYAKLKEHRSIRGTTGEVYTSPEEIELGTLKYMVDNQLLYVSSQDYFELYRYREARNKLSHLTPLSIDEIQELV